MAVSGGRYRGGSWWDGVRLAARFRVIPRIFGAIDYRSIFDPTAASVPLPLYVSNVYLSIYKKKRVERGESAA